MAPQLGKNDLNGEGKEGKETITASPSGPKVFDEKKEGNDEKGLRKGELFGISGSFHQGKCYTKEKRIASTRQRRKKNPRGKEKGIEGTFLQCRIRNPIL